MIQDELGVAGIVVPQLVTNLFLDYRLIINNKYGIWSICIFKFETISRIGHFDLHQEALWKSVWVERNSGRHLDQLVQRGHN